MDELFEKIQKLIVEKLDIDASKVTMEASFRNDLGADSLDTYELVYAIEEELGVSIPDERANEFETVRDAYEFIKAELGINIEKEESKMNEISIGSCAVRESIK